MKNPKSPPHPGQYLQQLVRGYEVSPPQLADLVGTYPTKFTHIISGRTRVVPQAAIWLEQLFGVSAQFWMHAQAMHELHLWKRAHPLTRVIRLAPPKNIPSINCFDKCTCGHWGWHHQDFPTGPCLEEFCRCDGYQNLGDLVKKTTKELGYTEEVEKWK